MGVQGTAAQWRKDHMESIRHLRASGVGRFEWSTAGDEFVCPKCRERHGKIYTFDEIKAELKGKFCCPGDKDDRCRCVIMAAASSDDYVEPTLRPPALPRKKKSKARQRETFMDALLRMIFGRK